MLGTGSLAKRCVRWKTDFARVAFAAWGAAGALRRDIVLSSKRRYGYWRRGRRVKIRPCARYLTKRIAS
jgi:hypothetical protein